MPGFDEMTDFIAYQVQTPDLFDKTRWKDITDGVAILYGHLKDGKGWEIQALRFAKDKFDLAAAKAWVTAHPDILAAHNSFTDAHMSALNATLNGITAIDEGDRVRFPKVPIAAEGIFTTPDGKSKGFRSADEVRKMVPFCNGLRVVINHPAPTTTGVTAAKLADNEYPVLGYTENAFVDEKNGITRANADIVILKTDRAGNDNAKLIKTMENGQLRCLSIGYFYAHQDQVGEEMGQNYDHLELDVNPYHLALLDGFEPQCGPPICGVGCNHHAGENASVDDRRFPMPAMAEPGHWVRGPGGAAPSEGDNPEFEPVTQANQITNFIRRFELSTGWTVLRPQSRNGNAPIYLVVPKDGRLGTGAIVQAFLESGMQVKATVKADTLPTAFEVTVLAVDADFSTTAGKASMPCSNCKGCSHSHAQEEVTELGNDDKKTTESNAPSVREMNLSAIAGLNAEVKALVDAKATADKKVVDLEAASLALNKKAKDGEEAIALIEQQKAEARKEKLAKLKESYGNDTFQAMFPEAEQVNITDAELDRNMVLVQSFETEEQTHPDAPAPPVARSSKELRVPAGKNAQSPGINAEDEIPATQKLYKSLTYRPIRARETQE